MMGSKQLIIYSNKSKEIHRIIIDDDDYLIPEIHCQPGESFLFTDKMMFVKEGRELPDLHAARAAVKAATEPIEHRKAA